MRFAVVAVLFLVSVPFAAAQEGGNAARGLAFARSQCAECHAVEPTDGFSPGARAASFVHIANTPGMTATALSVWFQTPHRTMPNFIIPASDRRDVIAYIMSLSTKQ